MSKKRSASDNDNDTGGGHDDDADDMVVFDENVLGRPCLVLFDTDEETRRPYQGVVHGYEVTLKLVEDTDAEEVDKTTAAVGVTTTRQSGKKNKTKKSKTTTPTTKNRRKPRTMKYRVNHTDHWKPSYQRLHHVVFSDKDERWLDLAELRSDGRLWWQESDDKALLEQQQQRDARIRGAATRSPETKNAPRDGTAATAAAAAAPVMMAAPSANNNHNMMMMMMHPNARNNLMPNVMPAAATAQQAQQQPFILPNRAQYQATVPSAYGVNPPAAAMYAHPGAMANAAAANSNNNGPQTRVMVGHTNATVSPATVTRANTTTTPATTTTAPDTRTDTKTSTPPKTRTTPTKTTATSTDKKPAAGRRRSKGGPDIPWLKDMDHFLQNVPHGRVRNVASPSNARSVLRQLEKLAAGVGVSHRSWGSTVFYAGHKVDTSTDPVTLRRDMEEFHKIHPDTSGGWMLRHPLKRFECYLQFLKEHPEGAMAATAAGTVKTGQYAGTPKKALTAGTKKSTLKKDKDSREYPIGFTKADLAGASLGLELSDAEFMAPRGAVVKNVREGSLAERLGVRVGWRTASLNGVSCEHTGSAGVAQMVRNTLEEASDTSPITFVFRGPPTADPTTNTTTTATKTSEENDAAAATTTTTQAEASEPAPSDAKTTTPAAAGTTADNAASNTPGSASTAVGVAASPAKTTTTTAPAEGAADTNAASNTPGSASTAVGVPASPAKSATTEAEAAVATEDDESPKERNESPAPGPPSPPPPPPPLSPAAPSPERPSTTDAIAGRPLTPPLHQWWKE